MCFLKYPQVKPFSKTLHLRSDRLRPHPGSFRYIKEPHHQPFELCQNRLWLISWCTRPIILSRLFVCVVLYHLLHPDPSIEGLIKAPRHEGPTFTANIKDPLSNKTEVYTREFCWARYLELVPVSSEGAGVVLHATGWRTCWNRMISLTNFTRR